jgi:hypothetical protein
MPATRKGRKRKPAIRKIKPRAKRRKVVRLRTQQCITPGGIFVPCEQLVQHLMYERQHLTPRRPSKPKTPQVQVVYDGPQ